MRANPPDPWVLIGRIGKAHALDGSVRVWPEADLGEIFDNQVPLKLWLPPKEPSRDLIPLAIREGSDSWVVLWEGIESREATLALRNGWLVARREDLPELKEDSVYWDDLLGAKVETKTGESVGKVIEIHDVPAQTVIEIEREDGGRFLLPLSLEVDADFQKSDSKGEKNRLLVHLPDGIVEATSVEPSDRPRKRDRRELARKKPQTSEKE